MSRRPPYLPGLLAFAVSLGFVLWLGRALWRAVPDLSALGQ
jgi:hypothetical protein